MKNSHPVGFPKRFIRRPLPTTQPCWRAGTLLPYETFSSIMAKLAAFNCVGLSSLDHVLEPFWNNRPGNEVSPFDSDNWNLPAFARWLGEPLSRLREASVARWVPDGMEHVLTGPSVWGRLRFCPLCVRVGYHAIFHQLPWFENCLVHGLTLSEINKPLDRSMPRRDGGFAEELLCLYPRSLRYAEASGLCKGDQRWMELPKIYMRWLRRLQRQGVFALPARAPLGAFDVSDVLHAGRYLGLNVPAPLVPHLRESKLRIASSDALNVRLPEAVADQADGAVADNVRSLIELLTKLRFRLCWATERRPAWRIGVERQMREILDMHAMEVALWRQARLFQPEPRWCCHCPACQNSSLWQILSEWNNPRNVNYLSPFEGSSLEAGARLAALGVGRGAKINFAIRYGGQDVQNKPITVLVLSPSWRNFIDYLLLKVVLADSWRCHYETFTSDLSLKQPMSTEHCLLPLIMLRIKARVNNRSYVSASIIERAPSQWPDWMNTDADRERSSLSTSKSLRVR